MRVLAAHYNGLAALHHDDLYFTCGEEEGERLLLHAQRLKSDPLRREDQMEIMPPAPF